MTTLLVRIFFFFIFLGITLFLLQDILLFPALVYRDSLFESSTRNPETLPEGVESDFVETVDGKQIEVWRMEPADTTKKNDTAFCKPQSNRLRQMLEEEHEGSDKGKCDDVNN